ncbi:MAG: Ig-like domain-containing protein, partial [Gemmatimonadetes bacterium]|nr:Ig-like domain-containing protein [Gemmatimonadota bacterium]
MSKFLRLPGKWLLWGPLVAAAAACSTEPEPAVPTPTSLTVVSGDLQSGTVSSALGQPLVVRVDDQNGATMSGIGITFAVTWGDATPSSPTANTNASGQASTDLTLGTTSGPITVSATVTSKTSVTTTLTATADPDVPDALTIAGGNNQVGLVSADLTDAIEARVEDQFGNGVPGETVAFAVTGGGGSITASAVTDAAGIASATWTLGAGTGAIHTAEASLSGLTGSPATFDATGTTLFMTSVTPDPLVEAGTATFTGTGFDEITPSNNTVTVDGQAATVTASTLTTLTVTMPTFDCEPARDVTITAMRSGETSNAVVQRLHPASTVSLTVGQQQILSTPAGFCLQFLPDAIGGDSYLIGVSATAEIDAEMAFMLAGTAGAASAPGMVMAPSVILPSAAAVWTPTPLELEQAEREDAYALTEMRFREWERVNLDLTTHPELRSAAPGAQAAQVVPMVGDMIDFNVVDVDATGDFCNNFFPITTVVRVVGDHGIFVTDIANPSGPTDDSLTLAELQDFSTTFDNDIYDMLIDNFDLPTDLDANGGRIFIVLTWEVNKFAIGAAGFVSGTDLLDPLTCAASDEGEIFYGYVPDPNRTSGGPFAQSKAGVIANMPALIAHEVTHTIQTSRRNQAGGAPMASWEAEGQADLAKELLGFFQRGDMPAQDYGDALIQANGLNDALYAQRFSRLGRYFGWDLGTGKITGAPELCSLYSFTDPNTGCKSAYFY